MPPMPLKPPPTSLLDRYTGDVIQPVYTARVRVTGGEAEHARASGVARSDDGNLDVQLRLPAELGGEGGGTNPEQLFAAGYAACFHGALCLLAARSGIAIGGASVDVAVTFARDPMDGLYLLSADLTIALPGVERAQAEQLVRNTERFCPYAKMARHGINSVITLAPDRC
ncbi:Ohr family peroxiredoxin [Duganella callida]|uniref:Ohr family peroxiredoxin n=1 Tax=Duganella callida TaxID=2561932 RepID=A0A4Y9S482_9BURK|nr:Ohr family peroxiredoxin [Duganella callida]TFW14769.1 Ohr family peroxiredoxin [Duganella callida]